jgi:penicillin-binding protein 1C
LIIKKHKIASTLIAILLLLFLLNILFPLPQPKTYSKEIYSSNGTLLTAYLTNDDKWRMKTTLDKVSPELLKAIIAKEDSWFYWHPGINIFAIARAAYLNIISGKRISGASTITMQLARLLQPAERTYLNKLIEILRAFQLELHYSKDKILEMYLSYLPYGGNIEGVKSASFIYFNRPANKLSLAQAVTLAIIPNNPNKYRLDRVNKYILNKRNIWLNKFKKEKIFPDKVIDDALDEPLDTKRYSIPKLAPHFSNYLAENYNGDILQTTIDLRLQKLSEKLLLNYVERVKGKDVTNGAVLVIDNRNMNIVAYCGSADFYNNATAGQVNGIVAMRSPGSTLKPFLYAQAFDSGLLTPKMKLLDIPTDFSGYLPENFDLKFNGNVTVEFALINSLNIPAVRLLRKTGLNTFLNILEKENFTDIKKRKEQFGLSVILGGCGVTLEQLTRAYTVFAQDGELFNINYLKNNNKQKERRIFSKASSYLIGNILSNNERPDFPNTMLNNTKLPRIAWKTGTSYGKRDAWAVGFNPRYTIGVWMGNFNGKGSPHLSGAEMAVPLLFDLFNSIDYNSDNKWFPQPFDVYKRQVCSQTGMLPVETCKDTTWDFFIENISPNKFCNLYKEIYVNEEETIAYCTECLPKANYKKVKYPFYNPELVLWYKKNNIEYQKPPKHNPKCEAKFNDEAPKIISPSKDYEYLIEENSRQEILLQAVSEQTVTKHYWFVNGKHYKNCKVGEKIFFNPKFGKNTITCVDDKGRESTVEINVKYY